MQGNAGDMKYLAVFYDMMRNHTINRYQNDNHYKIRIILKLFAAHHVYRQCDQ